MTCVKKQYPILWEPPSHVVSWVRITWLIKILAVMKIRMISADIRLLRTASPWIAVVASTLKAPNKVILTRLRLLNNLTLKWMTVFTTQLGLNNLGALTRSTNNPKCRLHPIALRSFSPMSRCEVWVALESRSISEVLVDLGVAVRSRALCLEPARQFTKTHTKGS